MKVRWSTLAREQFYDVLEKLVDKYGGKTAMDLRLAVETVERNLESGLVTYPMSKRTGIRKCLVLKYNLLLYMDIGQEIEIVGFISTSENHPY